MSAPGGQGSAPATSPNATVGSVHSPQPIGAISPKAASQAGSKAGPKVKPATKKAPKRKR